MKMTIDNGIRVMAGVMVLISLALSVWVSPWWLLLAVFVGMNLIQSAFSGFCPPGLLLGKLGFVRTAPVGSDAAPCCAPGSGRFPGQLLVGLLAGALLTGGAVWLALPGLMLVEHVSKYPTMEETVTRLQAALADQGWVSPGLMDMNKAMAKNGVEMERPVQVLNLCNPAHAKKVLEANPEISTLLPCSWGVYEADDGSIRISTMNMKLMGKMFGGTMAEVMGGSVAAEEHAMLSDIVQP